MLAPFQPLEPLSIVLVAALIYYSNMFLKFQLDDRRREITAVLHGIDTRILPPYKNEQAEIRCERRGFSE